MLLDLIEHIKALGGRLHYQEGNASFGVFNGLVIVIPIWVGIWHWIFE